MFKRFISIAVPLALLCATNSFAADNVFNLFPVQQQIQKPAQVTPIIVGQQQAQQGAVASLRKRISDLEQQNASLRVLVSEKDAALDRAIDRMSKNIGVRPPVVPAQKPFMLPPAVKTHDPSMVVNVADRFSGQQPMPTRRVDTAKSKVEAVGITVEDTAAILDAKGWERADFTGLGSVWAKYGADKTYLKIPEPKMIQAIDIFRRGLLSSLSTKDGHIGFVLDNKVLVIK